MSEFIKILNTRTSEREPELFSERAVLENLDYEALSEFIIHCDQKGAEVARLRDMAIDVRNAHNDHKEE